MRLILYMWNRKIVVFLANITKIIANHVRCIVLNCVTNFIQPSMSAIVGKNQIEVKDEPR